MKRLSRIGWNQSKWIDCFKLIASVLVIANHTRPLQNFGSLGFYFQNVLVRLDVPFFFVVSGFLVFQKLEWSDDGCLIWNENNFVVLKTYVKKLFGTYLWWTTIYFIWNLIQWLFTDAYSTARVTEYWTSLFYCAPQYHLWYVLASVYGFSALWLILHFVNWGGVERARISMDWASLVVLLPMATHTLSRRYC